MKSISCPLIDKLNIYYRADWCSNHKKNMFDIVRKMIVDELRWRAMVKRGYKANIGLILKGMEVKWKCSWKSLAKMSGVYRKKVKQSE